MLPTKCTKAFSHLNRLQVQLQISRIKASAKLNGLRQLLPMIFFETLPDLNLVKQLRNTWKHTFVQIKMCNSNLAPEE